MSDGRARRGDRGEVHPAALHEQRRGDGMARLQRLDTRHLRKFLDPLRQILQVVFALAVMLRDRDRAGDAALGVNGARHADDLRDTLERGVRSEEHTSELQSLMRNSYAVLCLKQKKNKITQ